MNRIDIFLGLILLLSLIAVVWPFAFYPLILRRLPTVPEQAASAQTPSASLLLCAYNEA